MSVKSASEQCDRIVETIDELDEETRDKSAEFFESIREHVVEVQETICESDRVSDKQQQALDNWEKGVNKWVHDD